MIDVVWFNGARGNWDSGLLCSVFDKHPEAFVQHNTKENPVFSRAIVIIVGRPDIGEVRAYLEQVKSGIVILTSEEDSFFDWKAAIPGRLEIWTQYYHESKKEIKKRLLLGPPNRIKDYKINRHMPKKYLWSFVGQVQNPFRERCVRALQQLPDGFLHIAGAFGGQENGIEYQEYLDIMCQSKFVICPAGSMCADSFRVYEAMECGAIPIADVRSPRDKFPFNYWENTVGICTCTTLEDWSLLLVNGFRFYVEHAQPDPNQINVWWTEYKQQLENDLLNAANQD